MSKTKMTPKAAQRIQSSTAKQSGGQVPKGTFATRAQRTVATSTKKGK